MLEFYIFLMIFILVSVTAVISSWGWLKAEKKNENLNSEKEMYQRLACAQKGELLTLRAERSFLRNQLEVKENA